MVTWKVEANDNRGSGSGLVDRYGYRRSTLRSAQILSLIHISDDLSDGPTEVEDALWAIGARILRAYRRPSGRSLDRTNQR